MVLIVKALLVFSINLISPQLPVCENTLLCFNSVNRHSKLVDVLKVSHLSFEIFSIFSLYT